jgi:hypothetical protein
MESLEEEEGADQELPEELAVSVGAEEAWMQEMEQMEVLAEEVAEVLRRIF